MYQTERDKIIDGANYYDQYLDGHFVNVRFRNCDFRDATIAGDFEDCVFEDSCLFESTQWPGSFWNCDGVGQ